MGKLAVRARLYRRLSCCAAALVALVSAASAAQTDVQLNLTREVLEVSGARAGLQRLPALVGSMTEKDPRIAGLAPDQRKKVDEKLKASVDPDRMYRTMAGEALKRFREQPFREFLAVYRTALAERFVELDLRALEPTVWEAKQAYLKTVTPAQMNQPRAVLLAELDEATGSSAAEAEVTLRGVSALLTKRGDETEEAFAARRDQVRQKVYVNARAKFIVEHLFTYESVSDADLERFVRLNQSEAVSYTSRVISVAALVAVLEGLDRLASALSE